ncbi:hypothetical protein GQ43DRAFT_409307 [Delitschia confertaspora ATCC 74209]|uniref:DUF7907 domain-containing protein n=1 Tax=Delitschia confertaspora ATCC 74209 TaxID=1513339 RepID=A0A9P4JW36_9PLEO|nr:hypothetical protein GQ43DRAFT_409307 [Delitschia confertaspora ATCC 74209]
MKSAILALALSLAVTVTAQEFLYDPPESYYPDQSESFKLVVVSSNGTVNGSTLSACHSGAAIETLCLSNVGSPSKPSDIPATPFNFNVSSSETTNTTNGPGLITYLLRGGNFNASSPMQFSYNPGSNVVTAELSPSATGQEVSFDQNGLLYISSYYDDTKPDVPFNGELTKLYRWYACNQYFGGYRYFSLAWVMGEGKPQNPTCVKVDVKRVAL